MFEQLISVDRMEHAVSLFGSFDENIRQIEQEFRVKVLSRGSDLKISGEADDVALVDEVGQRQALVLVLLGHGDHKAQVGGYEPLLCPFALASSFLDLLCQRYLLIDGDEWGPAYFHQILV